LASCGAQVVSRAPSPVAAEGGQAEEPSLGGAY